MAGDVEVEGGWRVYSSGAGIFLRLIHHCFLGLRRRRRELVVDPAIPKSLDGLRAETDLGDRRLRVTYEVGAKGCGPLALSLNGKELAFERAANPYRRGAAVVSMDAIAQTARRDDLDLLVKLE
jgi:cellobiose phosphorylase